MAIDFSHLSPFIEVAAALRGTSADAARTRSWSDRLRSSLADIAELEQALPLADPISVPPSAIPIAPTTNGGAANDGVSALAAAVRSGRSRAVDVAQAALDRAHMAVALNAFTALDAADVLRQAEALDAAIARGIDPGPLAGVPVAIKDLMPVRGYRMSGGTLAREPVLATNDAPVVARLRAAGAIIFGTANLHELAYGVTSANPHFGAVVNPRHPSLVPGGSSGGSAAIVAAGIAPLAIGTDTGGSIRIPAACCGIVGFKPSYGMVDKTGAIPLAWSLDHIGPLAGSVTDAALMFEVLAGWPAGRAGAAPTSPPKLRFVGGFFRDDVQPGVLAAVDRAAEQLGQSGARIDAIDIPAMGLAPGAQFVTLCSEATQANWETLRTGADKLGADVRLRLEIGQFFLGMDYVKAQRIRRDLLDACVAALGDADVLITPTLPCVAPPAGAATHEIAGRIVPVAARLTRFTGPFNLTGLPALSLVCGTDDAGLPVGLQIVGRPGADAIVLSVARWIEEMLAA